MIWFGIFIVIVVEMAQTTLPIGFNPFVLQGMTRDEIGSIAYTALLMVALLPIVPELATWLLEQMQTRP